MSKDLDFEGDSPDVSVHSDNDDISLKRQTWAMTLKSLAHTSESIHSFIPYLHPSIDEAVSGVSETESKRTTDLVRQPSCWGDEPSRVVGYCTRGNKATLKSTSPTDFSVHPISSSSTAGNGLNILSEACAAIGPHLCHSHSLNGYRLSLSCSCS